MPSSCCCFFHNNPLILFFQTATLQLFTALSIVEGRYFDLHHSANDVFEEVHPREMELGTAAIAVLAYLLSEEL